MKYNSEQMKRIDEQAVLLSGESQKSIWSLIRNNGKMRLKDISRKLGKDSSGVSITLLALIDYKLVQRYIVDSRPVRGVYSVSEYIMRGE